MMKIPVYLFFLFTMIGCQKKDLTKTIGEEITLCFEQKGRITDNGTELEITFGNLVEDSTCPEGSYCIWAGRVVVELTINNAETILLGLGDLLTPSSPAVTNSKEFGNYKITLLDADYGNKRNKGNEKKYYIKIRVDKK